MALCDCRTAIEQIDNVTTGYTGPTCEIPVPLENDPDDDDFYCPGWDSRDKQLYCLHGGTCRVQALDFEERPCICADGYSGRYCQYTYSSSMDNETAPIQLHPDDCPLTCNHRGRCEWGPSPLEDSLKGPNAALDKTGVVAWGAPGDDFTHQFSHCVCMDGHAGTQCQYEYTTCSKLEEQPLHYCFHGSSCAAIDTTGNGDMEMKCDCSSAPQSVAGDSCELQATDTCENPTELVWWNHPDPYLMTNEANDPAFCVNNGQCVQFAANAPLNPDLFFCHCPDEQGQESFQGRHCEVAFAPAPSPTDTAVPTPAGTDTWTPTVEGSLTDLPTMAITATPTSVPTEDGTVWNSMEGTIDPSDPDNDEFDDKNGQNNLQPNNSDNSDDNDDNVGAKIGISILVVALVGLLLTLSLYCRRRRRQGATTAGPQETGYHVTNEFV
eukprot:CAMPEP_0172440546 /NCGR_PEP_ID=MMETSP1065-20121228/1186_1 /TAXON_ID=265537 /ORGANISM="Amphiprora paludosa, Strain CCMP125" /LENGTH=437 /DNA_ID=CAMNT_0013189447 /DNA_START=338 /DNA_END=1651 /DNA_ORIENTATION=-